MSEPTQDDIIDLKLKVTWIDGIPYYDYLYMDANGEIKIGKAPLDRKLTDETRALIEPEKRGERIPDETL